MNDQIRSRIGEANLPLIQELRILPRASQPSLLGHDPEATLVRKADGTYRLRVRKRFNPSGLPTQVVSFIDKRDGTYQVFVLGDKQVDTTRIHSYLQSRGIEVGIDRVAGYVSALELKRERNLDRARSAMATRGPRKSSLLLATPIEFEPETPGPGSSDRDRSGGATQYYCEGWAFAQVETWEPARLFFDVDELTDTWTEANLLADEYELGGEVVDYGCWSNPSSFIYTTWYTDDCFGGVWYGYNSWEAYQTGEYSNSDFAHPDYSTHVSGGAMVGISDFDGAYWDTFYEESGANNPFENFLLSGHHYGHDELLCTYPPQPDTAISSALPKSVTVRRRGFYLTDSRSVFVRN